MEREGFLCCSAVYPLRLREHTFSIDSHQAHTNQQPCPPDSSSSLFHFPADKIDMQTLKRVDFLLLIDKLLAEPPGTVRGPEVLADLPVWDSLAAIGFVAMLDERLGITLPSGKMQACQTVADLVSLAGSQVQP